jgi:hypothetical protein
MFMYHENTGQNFDVEIMEKVKNLEMTLSNQHCLPRDIKSRLNSGYALDNSFQESSPFFRCLKP